MLKSKGKMARTVSEKLSCNRPGTLQPGVAVKKRLDIQALLIWTYQDQAAEQVTQAVVGRLTPAWYGNNIGAVIRHGALGVRVDCATSVVTASDLHPDAEAVHDAVRALRDPLQIGLVISHAKGGTEPDWMPEASQPRLVPILRGGKPKVEYWDREHRKPAYCVLTVDPDPECVTFARQTYTAWWDALAVLAARLQDDGLTSHDVTGPAAPERPWDTGR